MTLSKQNRALIFLAIAVLALILLAAGLSQMELQPGRPLPVGGEVPQIRQGGISVEPLEFDTLNVLLALGLWLILPVFVITFIFSPSFRRRILRLLPVYLMLLWGLMFLKRMMENNEGREVPLEEQGLGQQGLALGEALPTPPDYIADPPQWLVFSASLLVFLLCLGVVWLIWRKMSLIPPPDSKALITMEMEEAISDLKAGGDVKEIVLRCYADMVGVLQEQRGVRRDQTMTPREFAQHLAKVGFGDAHIQQLTSLFEEVRYGSKATGPLQEKQAIACLTAITQAYQAPEPETETPPSSISTAKANN